MKKFLIGGLTVFVVMWSMALTAFVVSPASAAVGDLVKSASSNTVYVVSADGVTICQFPHANVYSSWGYPSDFSTVMTKDLSSYTVGSNVEFRDASLVKGDGPAVYMVYNNQKRPIVSDVVFLALGYDWDDITWLSDAFLADYTTGPDVSDSSTHPDGQLVKYASNPAVYLIDGGMKRAFQSAGAFEANRYSWSDIITIPDTETYPDGSPITGYEQALSLPNCIGSVAQTGTGLTVVTSPTNPLAQTIVSDDTYGAQMLVPFLAVNFTASSDGDVKVTNLKFKRKGISSDSDIINTYLYDANMNRLAFGGSLSSNVLTFNDPTGLFTVPAGTTKTVYLRADLKENLAAGKTIGFDIDSTSGVTTDGAAVSGSFPVSGNLMTTANVSDLGYASFGSYSTPASSDTGVDSDQQEYQVWAVNVTANNQDMEIRGMRFTEVGSVQKDDLANFKLYAGGTLIGTVPSMNDDFEVFFDLSSSPYTMTQGQTKQFTLRADIVKGSTRTFKFTFQHQDDIVVYDTNYNVYGSTFDNDTWSIVQPTGNYKINSGSLTVTKATNSPTGNVALDSTNVKIASYEFKATGEDVKVNNLRVSVDTNVSGAGLDNGRILLDGVQIGSTTDFPEYGATTSTITFGSSFIAKAGQTHIVDLYADIKKADGTSFSDGDTLQAYLWGTSSLDNAQGQSSLTTIDAPGSDKAANQLSITQGSLTISKFAGYGDQTMVAGSKKALVGSAVFTAGSAEGVNVNSITVALSSAEAASTTNLYLMKDGVQIGTTKANPSTSNLFTVNFDIPASGSTIIEVYTDFNSNADAGPWTANIDATVSGLITGNSPSVTAQNLQTITLGTGSLTFAQDASSPDSDIIIAGTTKQKMTSVKFSALYENFEVQEVTVTTTVSFVNSVGKVYLEYPTETGTGQAEGYISGYSVTFTGLNMFVPRDDSAVMDIFMDVPTITSGADSGDEASLDLDASATFKAVGLGSGSTDTDADDSSGIVQSQSDAAGNDMVVRKTRPTVTLVNLPSTTLTNGTRTISKFTVTADAAEDVSLYEITWDISTSGPSTFAVSSPALYDNADQSQVTASSTTITGTVITINFSSEEVISAGTSKTYYLNATVANSDGTGDSILTRIASPYTTTVTDTAYNAAVNGKFVWSDNSASSHSYTTSDWANAEFVKTLPTDYQTLSN